jgi:putative transcriptional regulator
MILSIREIRDKLNLSQEQLANRLGVSYVTVNRWEKGKTKPSPLALEKIKNLGVK